MSKFAPSQLERFDWERGDVLSISREDAARLAALPVKMFAPPFHALLRWFLGESAAAVHKGIKDPRDRMVLDGLIEHQKTNAQRRGDFLTKQYEKSMRAKEARNARETPTGHPRDTRGTPVDVPSISKSKSKSSSVSDRAFTTTSGGGALPSAAPPSATNGTIKFRGKEYSAKQILAMLAPKEYFGHISSADEDRVEFDDSFAKATNEQVQSFLDVVLDGGYSFEEIGVNEDADGEDVSAEGAKFVARLRNDTSAEMLRFRREFGSDVLGRVMWKVYAEHMTREDDSQFASEVRREISSRLVLVAEALAAMRRGQ